VRRDVTIGCLWKSASGTRRLERRGGIIMSMEALMARLHAIR
jgi:ribosomal protein L18E